MRIIVVGAGAIGGFLAAALARAGISTGVVARGSHLEAIREAGLRVESSDLGSFVACVDAAADVRDLPQADILLLTFKAHQWPSFMEQLKPASQTGTPIVTLQNGVPFWFVRTPPLNSVDPGGRIGAMFDDAQIVGGVVHVSGHIARPGVVVQSGGLRYIIGDVNDHAQAERGTGASVEGVAALFVQAGLQAEIDSDLRKSVWFKLVGNASLNPTSVVTGMTIGQIMRDEKVLADVRGLMIEVLRVGEAMGLVDDVEGEAERRIAYAARLDDVKSSMLQDAEAGRSLEIEPILGATIELAERYGVDVPRQRAMYERLRVAAAR
jgi:2-dehydropantoate 2-reductase